MDIAERPLPVELALDACERQDIGETNTVYQVRGRYRGAPLVAYLKVRTHAAHHLANEYAVLQALASSCLPVPRVVWASAPRDMLLLDALEGRMLWDVIDPRRMPYQARHALAALHAYGALLGRIHRLALPWSPQPRARLYGLIGEEHVGDPRMHALIDWLAAHAIASRDTVFVHGDYNTANVLLRDGAVSGVVDWEYAGQGWKEYELAWALRARRAFLNTQPERDAFLQGYGQYHRFDPQALRWCEVLNYLHDAYWSRACNNPAATEFSLAQAEKLTA